MNRLLWAMAVVVGMVILVPACVSPTTGASETVATIQKTFSVPSGLEVSVETTDAAAAEAASALLGQSTSPPEDESPPEGMRRLTIIATATNSTESTLSTTALDNEPTLTDFDGRQLEELHGWTTESGPSPDGELRDADGLVLLPGGKVVMISSYALAPDSEDVMFSWKVHGTHTVQSALR